MYPKKVETLSPCLLDAGLRFVQRKSNPGHHTPRPIQRLSRATATENHEIIGVVDNLGVENLTPSGDPPVLQKTVHIQVGEQRADHSPYTKGNLGRQPNAYRRLAVSLKESGYYGES